MSDETIYAISSGQGRAGVCVIRVSGQGAGGIMAAMCGNLLAPRSAHLVSIRHPSSAEILDRGLVLWFPGPHSFTGEDVLELHVHGGPAVVSAVLSALAAVDFTRIAEPGEFTRRAFYNDKLDLTEIEALADLIEAETQSQRQQALRQMSGGLSEVMEGWRSELINILAYVEAGIDFSDEDDVPDDVSVLTFERIKSLRDDVFGYLDDNRSGERLRDGLRVVIAGPPNAGKSSLLNALAQRDVAIVSEMAGTTRDVIEVHLDLNGFPVTIFDTAGLRAIENVVEQEGVRRAVDRMAAADVVLWTTDGSVEETALEHPIDSDQLLIRIRNKQDLDSISDNQAQGNRFSANSTVYSISVKTGFGLSELVDELSAVASCLLSAGERVVVTRARHRDALNRVIGELSAVLDASDRGDELIAEGLRVAARELGRVTGRVDVEDLLDVIFNDFCVGK